VAPFGDRDYYEFDQLWLHGGPLVNYYCCCPLFDTHMTTKNNIVRISKEEWTSRLSLLAVRKKREKYWQDMLGGHKDFEETSDAWEELWDLTMRHFGELYGVGSPRYEKIIDGEWNRQIDIYLESERQGKVINKIYDRAKYLKKLYFDMDNVLVDFQSAFKHLCLFH